MTRPIIKQIPVGDYEVFTYIVACPETKEAVIIDPAGEAARLAGVVQDQGFAVKYVLNTHGHADHVVANQELKDVLDVPICMHEADDDFFSKNTSRSTVENDLGFPSPESVDVRLKDGDALEVGTLRVEVLHTPGHTPGSVCFLVAEHLFTGDTLFVGAAGRTDLEGASLDSLLNSIEKKLLDLPEETVIWPGHDYGDSPTSTMGREKKENIYITDFILDA